MRAQRFLGLSVSPVVAVAALTFALATMPQATAATSHNSATATAPAAGILVPQDDFGSGYKDGYIDGYFDGSNAYDTPGNYCLNYYHDSYAPVYLTADYSSGYDRGYNDGWTNYCVS
ncbi:hypothetical protein [Streptomyces sp. NPDC059378]|uniref:hypothetical protein n=1 Tax=Streptomyces sp. NPDC059378 TaxID=3346815 RepID=UPI00367F3B7B